MQRVTFPSKKSAVAFLRHCRGEARSRHDRRTRCRKHPPKRSPRPPSLSLAPISTLWPRPRASSRVEELRSLAVELEAHGFLSKEDPPRHRGVSNRKWSSRRLLISIVRERPVGRDHCSQLAQRSFQGLCKKSCNGLYSERIAQIRMGEHPHLAGYEGPQLGDSDNMRRAIPNHLRHDGNT